jgi:hypothetical protein
MSLDDLATTRAGPADLVCRRFKNPVFAFGAAVDLLRTHKPFLEAPFGAYASVLRGQIAREHYVFAVQNRMVVGYVGWALCNEDVALAWTQRRHAPKYKECLSGDCWVGLTYYAKSLHATFATPATRSMACAATRMAANGSCIRAPVRRDAGRPTSDVPAAVAGFRVDPHVVSVEACSGGVFLVLRRTRGRDRKPRPHALHQSELTYCALSINN